MIIAVDFDGTLCGESNFPEIGEPKLKVIEWVKLQRTKGHKIVLWTCREEQFLIDAVKWALKHGVVFDAVNENIQDLKGAFFGRKKIIADIYLDDKAFKLSDINSDLDKFERGQ